MRRIQRGGLSRSCGRARARAVLHAGGRPGNRELAEAMKIVDRCLDASTSTM
jgi:hypothetical protein